MGHIEQLIDYRRTGTPIIVVECADGPQFVREVKAGLECAVLQWDVCRGVVGVNALGAEAAAAVNKDDQGQPPAIVTGNPIDALTRALELLPQNCVLLMHNLHLALENPDNGARMACIQAVSNCRDPWKSSKRTLVIVCPGLKVPAELANDVVTISIALPDRAALEGVIKATYRAVALPEPSPEVLERGFSSLLGLSPFAAEQVASTCIRKSGLDVERCWEMKIADINRTPGLRAERGGKSKFENLLGLDSITEFGKALLAGEEAPAVIVLWDEVEKQFAGNAGDNTGVSQDQTGVLLNSMEENGWDGMLLPGAPGAGKTEFGKCLGNAAGMFIWADLGSMKNSLVGASERMIRNVMQKLKAIGGSRVFHVMTCNSVANIPGPLYRRLSAGTYFFDLPEKKAQNAMWNHYMKQNGLMEQDGLASLQKLPEHAGWTGAEIKKCCVWARRLRQSVVESGKRITPVCKTMEKELKSLRLQAVGNYLSASHEGFYKGPSKDQPAERQIDLGKN